MEQTPPCNPERRGDLDSPNRGFTMIRRIAAAAAMGVFMPGVAPAQSPAPGSPPPAPAAAVAPPAPQAPFRGYRDPLPTNPADPNYHSGAYHSIVRHNPLPNRTAYRQTPASSPGSRTEGSRRDYTSRRPGGVFSTGGAGVNAEYYDEHTLDAPANAHQAPVARFDSGGGPDRAEQIAAQQAGVQRSQLTQNTINTFGTPYAAYGAGYGYGLGLAGGRLYGFPY